MELLITKYRAATIIAVFFHLVGLVGILFFNNKFFVQATPFNLLLSAALLIWTQNAKNYAFLGFLLITFLTGFLAEVVGVNTGVLFGDYVYGNVLGYKWLQAPLLIGLNWIIVIYCCGISTHTFMKVINKVAQDTKQPPAILKSLSVIMDGATLAVAFDWLMEPVAVKLGFWAWKGNGDIPLYNYFCWFLISVLLLTAFHFLRFNKQNKFAVNLLLIQAMFFLILRTFLR